MGTANSRARAQAVSVGDDAHQAKRRAAKPRALGTSSVPVNRVQLPISDFRVMEDTLAGAGGFATIHPALDAAAHPYIARVQTFATDEELKAARQMQDFAFDKITAARRDPGLRRLVCILLYLMETVPDWGSAPDGSRAIPSIATVMRKFSNRFGSKRGAPRDSEGDYVAQADNAVSGAHDKLLNLLRAAVQVTLQRADDDDWKAPKLSQQFRGRGSASKGGATQSSKESGKYARHAKELINYLRSKPSACEEQATITELARHEYRELAARPIFFALVDLMVSARRKSTVELFATSAVANHGAFKLTQILEAGAIDLEQMYRKLNKRCKTLTQHWAVALSRPQQPMTPAAIMLVSLLRGIGTQVLTAVAYLHHAAGLIHADVKPENFVMFPGSDMQRVNVRLLERAVQSKMGKPSKISASSKVQSQQPSKWLDNESEFGARDSTPAAELQQRSSSNQPPLGDVAASKGKPESALDVSGVMLNAGTDYRLEHGRSQVESGALSSVPNKPDATTGKAAPITTKQVQLRAEPFQVQVDPREAFALFQQLPPQMRPLLTHRPLSVQAKLVDFDGIVPIGTVLHREDAVITPMYSSPELALLLLLPPRPSDQLLLPPTATVPDLSELAGAVQVGDHTAGELAGKVQAPRDLDTVPSDYASQSDLRMGAKFADRGSDTQNDPQGSKRRSSAQPRGTDERLSRPTRPTEDRLSMLQQSEPPEGELPQGDTEYGCILARPSLDCTALGHTLLRMAHTTAGIKPLDLGPEAPTSAGKKAQAEQRAYYEAVAVRQHYEGSHLWPRPLSAASVERFAGQEKVDLAPYMRQTAPKDAKTGMSLMSWGQLETACTEWRLGNRVFISALAETAAGLGLAGAKLGGGATSVHSMCCASGRAGVSREALAEDIENMLAISCGLTLWDAGFRLSALEALAMWPQAKATNSLVLTDWITLVR